MRNTQKSVKVFVKVGDEILAGQLSATLRLTAASIDITNKIQSEWKEYLIGAKSWSIACDGLYVKNNDAFLALQTAFLNNENVVLSIEMDDLTYRGNALITEFPLIASYDDTYKYRVRFLGDGALEPVVNG